MIISLELTVNDHEVVSGIVATWAIILDVSFEDFNALHLRNEEELPASGVAHMTCTRHLERTNCLHLAPIEAMRVSLRDAVRAVIDESDESPRRYGVAYHRVHNPRPAISESKPLLQLRKFHGGMVTAT
jgi:hypothetical protein